MHAPITLQAHNLKVAGSNFAKETKKLCVYTLKCYKYMAEEAPTLSQLKNSLCRLMHFFQGIQKFRKVLTQTFLHGALCLFPIGN